MIEMLETRLREIQKSLCAHSSRMDLVCLPCVSALLLAWHDKLFVPGNWVCDVCKFVLTKRTPYVESGTVGVDKNPVPEPCPNDGSKMRPQLWKEYALTKQIDPTRNN